MSPLRWIPLVVLLSGCYAMQQKRVSWRLDKEKTEAALKLAKKVRTRQVDKENERSAELLYQKALFSDIVAFQSLPRLHFFINEFPENANSTTARLILLEWSMAEAESFPSEAVFQGLARQHQGRREASGATARAERMSYENLKEFASATDLHSFLLRYPNGRYSDQVELMEADISFIEAEAEDTVPAWRDFIRRYPEHERRSEAAIRLRGAAWREVSDSSTAELWAYAEEYTGSEEGWKAAVQALELSTWYQRDQTLEEAIPVSRPASQLVLSLGSPPAPGHEIEVRVDVEDGEEWISSSEWARKTAPTLGLESPIPESAQAYVKVRSDQLEWVSRQALCSTSKEALSVRLCSRMSLEEQSHETCLPLKIDALCHGARELVFLEHDDDLVGPIGHLLWNPEKNTFDYLQTTMAIPEDWACTHVSGIDSYGAEVGCGRLAIRIGWEPGQQWIRQVDPDTAMVDRIDLVPVVASDTSPIKLNSSGDIYNLKRKLIRRSDGRRAVRAQAPQDTAFSPKQMAQLGAPSLLASKEQPLVGTSMILPEGADIIWTSTAGEHRSTVPTELLPFLGAGISSGSYAETLEAPIGPAGATVVVHHVPTLELSVFLIVTQDDPYAWQELLFVPGHAGGPRSDWMLFQIGDSLYLRTMGTHPSGLAQTVTLRWSKGRFHLDAVAIGHGAP